MLTQLAQMFNIYFDRYVDFVGRSQYFRTIISRLMERKFLVQIPIGDGEIQLEEKYARFGKAICDLIVF